MYKIIFIQKHGAVAEHQPFTREVVGLNVHGGRNPPLSPFVFGVKLTDLKAFWFQLMLVKRNLHLIRWLVSHAQIILKYQYEIKQTDEMIYTI